SNDLPYRIVAGGCRLRHLPHSFNVALRLTSHALRALSLPGAAQELSHRALYHLSIHAALTLVKERHDVRRRNLFAPRMQTCRATRMTAAAVQPEDPLADFEDI
ncbi:hypothetical protein, partial [Tropicimonas sediminicola]|uniref:hypothetical protein n=1 Tax=Tropicimonas sediminicola TaxID=1031541 RepID=UPI001C3DA50C